jgi:hypothetical protein
MTVGRVTARETAACHLACVRRARFRKAARRVPRASQDPCTGRDEYDYPTCEADQGTCSLADVDSDVCVPITTLAGCRCEVEWGVGQAPTPMNGGCFGRAQAECSVAAHSAPGGLPCGVPASAAHEGGGVKGGSPPPSSPPTPTCRTCPTRRKLGAALAAFDPACPDPQAAVPRQMLRTPTAAGVPWTRLLSARSRQLAAEPPSPGTTARRPASAAANAPTSGPTRCMVGPLYVSTQPPVTAAGGRWPQGAHSLKGWVGA